MRRPSPRTLVTLMALAAVTLLPAVGSTTLQLDARVVDDSLRGLDRGRVFPDPLVMGDFIQYTPGPSATTYAYLDGLAELTARYGGDAEHHVITVSEICDLVCSHMDSVTLAGLGNALVSDMAGNPVQITSAGGRALPVITVTAPETPRNPLEDRIDLYFSMSIHGLERAGLEGALRYIEDLAIDYVEEQTGGEGKVLRAGDPTNPDYVEYATTEALQKARLHFINPNPDGWADGDRNGGRGLYKRGNDNGIDLNRQWPTLGWHSTRGQQYRTGSQPEAAAVRALIEDHLGVPQGAADLHGEFGDNVLLAIMFPAGQFDPLQLQGQFRLAEAIKHNVNNSVHPGAGGLLTNIVQGPVYPAEYHTAYDAIGYDDSGFQGDYLVQQGILEMDHEYIFSNLAPASVFIPELEQVHVDTTRALLDATIAVTIGAYDNEARELQLDYTADLDGRRVGYVFDPRTVDHTDVGAPAAFGLPQVAYAASNMAWFDVLALHSDSEVTAIPRAEVATTDLAGFDTIVVADDSLDPNDIEGWQALAAWTQAAADHRLVLTDAALRGLETMAAVPAGSVGSMRQYAGEVQGVDRDHPLLTGIGGLIGQTYFEVPLGYRPGTSPAWFVDGDQWSGSTAAVVGQTDADADLLVVSSQGGPGQEVVLVPGDPAVGTMGFGAGSITIMGAILPTPSNVGPNTHGLADYALTYAGNGMLLNAIAGR
ncbi:hypothetical protein BH23ACT9_BH23ACT9_24130 [soil metagenome]